MSRAGASAESDDDRALSPELVLVDPELARWAREQLSKASPDSQPASITAVAPTEPRRLARRVLSWAFVSSAVVAAGALALSAATRSDHRAVLHRTPATPATVAAKRFVWPPKARASYYVVEFFRGRTKIFESRVTRPTLALPAHWTYRGRRYSLARGLYEWRVRPGFGRSVNAHLGAAIVRSTLVVR